MSRFYLTLPSNSSATDYPDNTVAQYITKLDGQIELQGDWQVRLVEISTPGGLMNVGRGDCYMNVFVKGHSHCRVILQAAYHKQERKLIEALHNAQWAIDAAGSASKMLQTTHCAGRNAQSAERAATPAHLVQQRLMSYYSQYPRI